MMQSAHKETMWMTTTEVLHPTVILGVFTDKAKANDTMIQLAWKLNLRRTDLQLIESELQS